MTTEPYVSFVSYFRNDNYTSDFVLRVKRATHFSCWPVAAGGDRIRVDPRRMEPSPDRPMIVESLGALPQGGNVRVRAIVVGRNTTRSSQARRNGA